MAPTARRHSKEGVELGGMEEGAATAMADLDTDALLQHGSAPSLSKRQHGGGIRGLLRRPICQMIIVASCILPLGIVIGYVGSELSAHRALGRGDLVFTMAAQKDEGFDVLRLLVVGDWGREGAHHQRDVALQMGLVGEVLRPDAIISTGDNFYPSGLKRANDSLIAKSFAGVYDSPSLDVPWYAVLGNHDWGDSSSRGDDRTRAAYQRRDSATGAAAPGFPERWQCCGGLDFVKKSPTDDVDLFFVDTSPFVRKYASEPWAKPKGGLEGEAARTDEQLAALGAALRESTAGWKIVFGHHGVYSNGQHGNTRELESVLPALLRETGVALYVNGHDHVLQDISDPHR